MPLWMLTHEIASRLQIMKQRPDDLIGESHVELLDFLLAQRHRRSGRRGRCRHPDRTGRRLALQAQPQPNPRQDVPWPGAGEGEVRRRRLHLPQNVEHGRLPRTAGASANGVGRSDPKATRRGSGGLLSADNMGEGGWANRWRIVSVRLLIAATPSARGRGFPNWHH